MRLLFKSAFRSFISRVFFLKPVGAPVVLRVGQHRLPGLYLRTAVAPSRFCGRAAAAAQGLDCKSD
jgi:hypothetical protein